ECLTACEVMCTQPCAYSRSLEPRVTSCGDSRAVVYVPPVVLTFPGLTLSSCSQESIVGTSFSRPYGALIPFDAEESNGTGVSLSSGDMSDTGLSFGSDGFF
ncbi:KRFA protein, partial [Rhinopomastus cyanomelas]|nr:KRFA protein [Rhinopomastus cyanomelas]